MSVSGKLVRRSVFLAGVLAALGACTSGQHHAAPMPVVPTAAPTVAFTGLTGGFVRGPVVNKFTPQRLSEGFVKVLSGANANFGGLGGPTGVASSRVGADGHFKIALAPGEYTVGVYTISYARGRTPCAKLNVKILPSQPSEISLRCG